MAAVARRSSCNKNTSDLRASRAKPLILWMAHKRNLLQDDHSVTGCFRSVTRVFHGDVVETQAGSKRLCGLCRRRYLSMSECEAVAPIAPAGIVAFLKQRLPSRITGWFFPESIAHHLELTPCKLAAAISLWPPPRQPRHRPPPHALPRCDRWP
ncbi:hypothetical protein CBM2585_A160091 [Cupriavidus taiwanensis]|nr:hypothetical protein CBM2585_A160091 [Cupriavidus taiwanensis]